MNGDREMEVHYINTGFPYSATESFMDFFDGVNHLPLLYPHPLPINDQENAYWSMNMNAYKFGFPGPESAPYYGHYDVNDHFQIMEAIRRNYQYPSEVDIEEPTVMDTQPEGDVVMGMQDESEECIPNNPSTSSNSPQAVLQDEIDPDNMTYEELLDLGETLGTQSRGLSKEVINMLPTSKCKFGRLFSRKKSNERCVVCQMRYKRGDKQMKLPCHHVYHSECISKWLGINKVCPVCNNQVSVEESTL